MSICHSTNIAYDRAGPADGETVVLLHAGIADRGMWDPQWHAWSASHDVIRLDLRGFGESTARPDGRWTTYGDVLDTLSDLDVSRAHLVGCSMGSGVAVEVALAGVGIAQSLLLVAPGGPLIAARTPELEQFIAAENAALERGDLDAAAEANVRWWLDSPRRAATEVDPAVRDRVRAMQRRAFEITEDWEDVEEAEDELDPPALERLAELSVPTLVLLGDLDLDAIHEAARRCAEEIPAARLVTWPGTAHLPSMERPDEFAALVDGWVGEVSG